MKSTAATLLWSLFAAVAAVIYVGGTTGGAAADAERADAERADAERADAETGRPIDFRRDIKPLFAEHCYQCHGPETQESGLRLDRRDAAMKGGDSGAAVVPGDSGQSELVRRITADEDERMPPPDEDDVKPLSPQQIALITRWIDQNAPWPDDANAGRKVASSHWAYQPLESVDPPQVHANNWVRNGIDAFVLARLEADRIAPSPEADRFTLIKRLYYDLLGLPPSVEEVDAFVGDESADAYERLVDRLLASPHFGERWARHWLDMARYADSDGYEKDRPRPNAWRYRDWVIAAVNADRPFDQFTIEQLAGDLLPGATQSQKLATAFHRQTLTNTEGGTDQEEFRVAAVKDRVDTTGTVWLGLTVGCAKCHSHKYDQITQREYYQLFAFFNNGDEAEMQLPAPPQQLARFEKQKADYDRRLKGLRAKLASQETPSGEAAAGKVQKQLGELKNKAPKRPAVRVRVIRQRTSEPRTTHLLYRGDFLQPQAEVRPGTLAVLPPLRPRRADGPVDRLDLARWLVDPANPLAPRVAVNHIWAHLFGQGIVRTINDFGVRGEPPTHPRLLDWLAREFLRRGWSRKSMIRLIVTSATYRQSSRHRPELVEIDPRNDRLSRQNRFRVEAEIVRDLYLAVGGLLNLRIGGPSVFPPMPAGVAEISYANSFRWATSQGDDRYRRGMYTFFKRTAPHPNLTTFDCPDSNTTCVHRRVSDTPLQALTTLNNEVFVEASQAMAKRVLATEGLADDRARLGYAFRLCAARPPSEQEQGAFLDLLKTARRWYRRHADDAKQVVGRYQPEQVAPPEAAAWVATARILMNIDEFVTRE